MTDRMKATAPLALVIAILVFVWVEVALNFTFHWVSDGALALPDGTPLGLSLPGSFHLIVPAAFVSWGFFFAAGADNAALRTVATASVLGSVGGLFLMWFAPVLAELPDFWGIAVAAAVAAFVLVLLSAVGDWWYVPGIFGAFAATVFWWLATGADNWAPGGGGTENTVAALADPLTAGSGAFGGVLSTPYGWVWINILVTLLIGCLLGLLSAKIAAAITPAPAGQRERVE